MGTRIHKAIGWGLTDSVFRENLGFEIVDEDLDETLSDKLGSITSLVVPERTVGKIFEEWRGFIAEPNLLATSFRFDEAPTSFLENASSLYISVADYDQPTDVHLFLPSGLHTSLYRYDNTLDYIEATHDLTTGQFLDEPCPYQFVELQQNPYPWNDDYMDADGNQVKAAWGKVEQPDIIARPPAELRWWLTETGILKEDAWKLLRPYYAKWWG